MAPIRQKRFYCTVLLEQTSFFEVSYAIFYRALPCERFIGACGSLNVLSHAAKLTCQLHPSYDLQLTWEEAESIRLAGTRTANSLVK